MLNWLSGCSIRQVFYVGNWCSVNIFAVGIVFIRKEISYSETFNCHFKVISETYQEDEKCGLREIEYLNIIDPYYAVKKNSSFREIVRLALFRLREFGIQDREHSMIYTRKPRCTGGSSFIPVSIVDVWPALMLLAWGFGVSAGVFVVEKFLTIARKRNQVADANGSFFKRSIIQSALKWCSLILIDTYVQRIKII